MLIKHIHSSGRFDRTPASLKKAMDRYVADANLITLTEIHKDARREALEREGWTVVNFEGRGDSDPAVVVKDSDFEVVKAWIKQTTKHEQRRGPGGPRPPHALTVLLKVRGKKKKFLVSVIHLPSHVEGNWFRKFYWRVFVWNSAHKGWSRFLMGKRRRFTHRVMMVADWNLNFKRRVFRRLMKRLHPNLQLTWRKPFGKGGTHHKRIIDGTLTNLNIKQKARLYKDDDSSDHRPYREVLSI